MAATCNEKSEICQKMNTNRCHVMYRYDSDNLVYVSSCCQLKCTQQNALKGYCAYPSAIRDICVVRDNSKNVTTTYTQTNTGLWRTLLADTKSRSDDVSDVFMDLLDGDEGHTAAGKSDDTKRFTCGDCLQDCGDKDGMPWRIAFVNNSILTLVRTAANHWMLILYEICGLKNVRPLRAVHLGVLDQEKESKESSMLPGMYVAFPGKYSQCVSNKYMTMTPGLFQHVFRTLRSEVGDMPVAIVTSPDGAIHAAPLKNLSACKTSLISDFGEQIVFMNPTNITIKFSQGDPKLILDPNAPENCLIIIGCHGNIKMTLLNTTDEQPNVYHGSLLGQVKCAVIFKNLLIYSTGRDTFITDLAPVYLKLLESSGQSSQQEVIGIKHSLNSRPLGVCNVVSITTETPSLENKDQLREVSVALLTSRGHVIYRTASLLSESQHGPKARITPTIGGARINDLLTGITQVSDTLTKVKGQQMQQDSTLQQLHTAGLIVGCLGPGMRRDTLTGEDSPIIISWVLERDDREGRKNVVSHKIVFKIKLAVDLGSDWYVNLSISTYGSESSSQSVDISGLKTGVERELCFFCDHLVTKSSQLPLVISGNILYRLPAADEDGPVICLPLAHRTLDILYFLTPVSPSSDNVCIKETSAVVEQLSRMRPCFNSHLASVKYQEHQSKLQEVRSHVKYNIKKVVEMSHLATLRIQKNARSPDPRHLLGWLLRHNLHLTVPSVIGSRDTVTVHGSTPDSCQVALTVAYSPGDSTKVEIVAQSDSLCAVQKMEEALVNRLKISEYHEPTCNTSLNELRKLLPVTESLQREVEDLGVALTTKSIPLDVLMRRATSIYDRHKGLI